MYASAFYPWLRFDLGILLGCWIGAAVGLSITLILAARRVHLLEEANAMLRARLSAREKARKPEGSGGMGTVLVMPRSAQRAASAPVGRAASGR
jgi:hypothetical protein